MKIGIYNASLYTMGGGEKYIGVIAEYLSRKHKVEFITAHEVDKDLIQRKLHLDFSNVTIKVYKELTEDNLAGYLKEYDYFINSSYMSGFYAPTKESAIIIFFPSFLKHKFPIWFYQLKFSLLNKLIFKDPKRLLSTNNKLMQKVIDQYHYAHNFLVCKNYIKSYGKRVSISIYSQYWTKKELQVDSDILYPPVDIDQFIPGTKENIILSVGRFFVGNHSKKQLEMIQVFKEMYDKSTEVKDYEYHVCGGVGDSPENMEYLEKCKKEAEGYPIFIHENIAFDDLKVLYSKAKIFWHATGLNQNIDTEPDKFEHFGITTVEAMSAGVVPIVIGKAGQVEIVKNDFDGFLWDTTDELIADTLKVIKDTDLWTKLSSNSIESSKKFSKEQMYNRIKEIFNNL